MQNEYIIYVNGRGDCKLSESSSKMLCLGAFIIDKIDNNIIIDKANEIRKIVDEETLHAPFLENHNLNMYICREIAQMPITSFGVISNKKTLGSYNIKEPWKYYNKNCQYLFELIGKYIYDKHGGWVNHEIIFKQDNDVQYKGMANYISTIRNAPKKRKESEYLRYIDEISIENKRKDEMPALRIADFIAYSLYRSCNHYDAQYGANDNRYLKEIKNTFYHDSVKKNILNYGIKPVHNLKKLGLLKENEDFLKGLKSD